MSSVPRKVGSSDTRRERRAHEDALVRLNELSSRLWRAQSLHDGLVEMLSASIELLGADMGHVRLMDSARGLLVIAAQRGFHSDYLDRYREVSAAGISAAARALRSRERVVIEDIEADSVYAPLLASARAAGFRAVQSTPLLGHDGSPLGMVSTHYRMPHRPGEQALRKLDLYVRLAGDFVERCRADEALRASEERYRAVVENQSEMVCRFRVDGTVLFVNNAYAQALGTSAEKLATINFWEFIAPGDRDHVRSMLDALSPRNPTIRIENRFMTTAGERWTLWTNRALAFDADGRVVEAQSSGVDITERKSVEEALAKNARRMGALYGLTDRLQRVGSVEEVYETAMDAIVKALGCDRASILLFDEAGVMRFVASRGLSQDYRRAVEGHSPWRADEKDPRPFGIADIDHSDLPEDLKRTVRAERIAALAFVPLLNEGRLIGKFMIYFPRPHEFTHDEFEVALTIGHQIALGVQRRRAEEALRENDRRKDEFLATLSHELRNPLAPLRNALYLLRRGAAESGAIHEMMERQLNHLVRLVDDLLEMTRISRGMFELRRERVDVATIVRNAVEASGPLIQRARHHLDIRLPAEPLFLDGDPVRLAQILSNLLNNAAKYTEEGGRIDLEVRAQGGAAHIAVRDNGIGIEAQVLPRIFDMFGRADCAHARRGEASLGIGLALARRLVEMHGGTIDARSAGLGQGSEFTVRLPLAASVERHAVSASAPGIAPQLKCKRILVVDDNRDAADSLGMLLKVLGADVRVARDGVQALKTFSDYDPSVVLLDIGMPGMDGYEVARRIRDSFPERHTAIVAVTGWGQEEDRRRARDAGFDHHLIKPADVETLQGLLASL